MSKSKSKKVEFEEKALAVIPVAETRIVTTGSKLQEEGSYEGEKGTYTIYNIDGEPLFADEDYFLCVALLPDGQYGLVKGSASPTGYRMIERESRILATALKLADEIDAEEVEASRKAPVYSAYFPRIVEKVDMGEGQIGLFMGFHPSIASYDQFVPLSVLTDGARVDLQTVVWLLGKWLKCLSFVHSIDFALIATDSSNFLIECAQHGSFALNWMDASENASAAEMRADVVNAAKMVWEAAGGSDETQPPHDPAIMSAGDHERFVAHLRRIMESPMSADEEFDALYELADSIWKKVPSRRGDGHMQRPYHIFVTYPR